MNFVKQLERYQKLHKLLEEENTGTPLQLAQKLNISRSHLYRLLGTFKDYGAAISYNRKQQTFYYTQPFNITKITNQNLWGVKIP